MSWHFSQALVAAYSAENSSAGAASAQSSTTNTPAPSSQHGKTTAASRRSRFGMMFAHLTDARGEVVLMSFLADFPARHIQEPREVAITRPTSGRKCGESSQMWLLHSYSPKMSPGAQSNEPRATSLKWDTLAGRFAFRRRTWVQTTIGRDTGFVHTPTVTANYGTPSMQKWKCCRNFVAAFGKPSTASHTWLMGWPPRWTDCDSPGTDRFRSWLLLHGFPAEGVPMRANNKDERRASGN